MELGKKNKVSRKVYNKKYDICGVPNCEVKTSGQFKIIISPFHFIN